MTESVTQKTRPSFLFSEGSGTKTKEKLGEPERVDRKYERDGGLKMR